MIREDSSEQILALRAAVGRVTDTLVALDVDFRYTYVSEAAADLLGETAAELQGTSVWDTFERDGIGVHLERAMETQQQTTVDRYDADDDRWIAVRIYPAADGLSLCVTDITERKRVEAELRQTNRRLAALVENSSDIISIVDRDGIIQYISPATQREAGIPPETLVGSNAFEHIHPDDRAEARDAFERALANPGEKHGHQYRGRQADGSWVWLESVSTNHPDNDDIGGLVVVTRDITERKRREQEKQELTEAYEAVFENADDGIFLVDVESGQGDEREHGAGDTDPVFRYSRLNPSHEARTGFTTTAVSGKTPREVLGDELGATAEQYYRRCVETRSAVTYDDSSTHPGDDSVWQTRLAPVVVDGTVTRIIGVARDVTERVEHEQELRRKNERLDEFASVISHDIRNPLSVALGRVQLLEAESETEHVPPILRSLMRIEAIVDDTLTLARQGETVAETEPISITSLVHQCWGTVDMADATLEVDEEFTIHGDRDRLRHVFENLFNNSVEHSSTCSRPGADDSVAHGGPDVTVRVGRLGDSEIYVEDDGPGIPETERKTVFEPGHKSSAGGTGFGLTIVRRIVEAHGWTVTATESESGGARFEFHGVDIVS